MKKLISRRKIFGYLIGLAILAALIYAGGVEAIRATLTPRLDFLFLYFLANLLLYASSSVRWGYLVNTVAGYRVCSHYDYFLFFMSARFFGQYVSQTGGDLFLRPGLLNRVNGLSFKKGFYIIFWEKIFDLFFVSSFIVPAILYLFNLASGLVCLVIAMIILISLFVGFTWKSDKLLIMIKRSLLWFYVVSKRVPWLNRWIQVKYLEKITNLDRLELLAKKTMLNLMFITLFRQLFVVSRLYFLALAVGLSIPLTIILAGTPVAQMSLLLAFTPGALGVLEGGWYVVFSLAGISPGDSAAFLLGQRTYSLIATSLIFLISYVIFGARQMFVRVYEQ